MSISWVEFPMKHNSRGSRNCCLQIEEFCSQVELMEDGIINDYVFGRLDEADAESFRATLAG